MIEAAERAALAKYNELSTLYEEGDFYSHGFARSGPISLKEGTGLDVDPEDTDPTLDRLPSILKYGLISADYARRIGLRFSRNFGNRHNNRGISIVDYSRRPLVDAFDRAENGYNFETYETGTVDNLYAVAIRAFFPLQHGQRRDSLFGYASYRSVRVAPRHFLALSTHKTVEQVQPEALEEVVGIMRKVYADKPALAVPYVDRNAKLLWPKVRN